MSICRSMVFARAVVFGAVMALAAPAMAILTPVWSGAVTDTASVTDFDTGTLMFPAISAGKITIAAPLLGYYHDHGGGGAATFSVLLNGVWTLVYTAPVSNGIDIPLSTLPVPLASFSPGQVTGVRLGCTIAVNQCYHQISPAMQFDLTAGIPNVVPTLSEYATLALMLLVMLAGMLVLRRRQDRR